MYVIKAITDSELEKINERLVDVHIAVSMSMAYIRKIQGWDFQQLEKRFKNITISTWQRYLQPSYTKMRPLHIVAAYSWLTMVPMPSFYRGLNIKESYRGMDDDSVEAMIHCGILPKRQFRLILDHLYEYISDNNKQHVDSFVQDIRDSYGSLDDYADKDFLFPEQLDIEQFAYDYYKSVALAFKKFREVNKLSIDTVAQVLNLSRYRYEQCENPENPVSLPVDIAARLKLGFRLTDAIPFTEYMTHYPQFHNVRRVQHIRETTLVEIMRYIHPKYKTRLLKTLKQAARTLTNIKREENQLEKVISSFVGNII